MKHPLGSGAVRRSSGTCLESKSQTFRLHSPKDLEVSVGEISEVLVLECRKFTGIVLCPKEQGSYL